MNLTSIQTVNYSFYYKSLEFYEFLQAKRNSQGEFYLIDIMQYKTWFDAQQNDSNFEEIKNDELTKMGFCKLLK